MVCHSPVDAQHLRGDIRVPRIRCKPATCQHNGFIYLHGGRDGYIPLKDLWRLHIGTNYRDCHRFLHNHQIIIIVVTPLFCASTGYTVPIWHSSISSFRFVEVGFYRPVTMALRILTTVFFWRQATRKFNVTPRAVQWIKSILQQDVKFCIVCVIFLFLYGLSCNIINMYNRNQYSQYRTDLG